MLLEKTVNFAEEQQNFWFSRIFSDKDHLLSVYYNRERQVIRFHFLTGLCSENKKNLEWSGSTGIRYTLVDSGETSPLTNCSPLSAGSTTLDVDLFWEKFSSISKNVDPLVTEFIKTQLYQYRNSKH